MVWECGLFGKRCLDEKSERKAPLGKYSFFFLFEVLFKSKMKSDPFDDGAKEVQSLLNHCDSVYTKLRRSCSTSSDGTPSQFLISQLEGAVQSVREEVTLLEEVVAVVQSRDNVVRGKKLSEEEIVRRDQVVQTARGRIRELDRALALMRGDVREEVDEAVRAAPRTQKNEENDMFLHDHVQQQLEEEQVHEATLDRLSVGVQKLHGKASTISVEIEEQEGELQQMDKEVTGVQNHLSQASKKVNHLLDNMSEKGRICCVLLLCLIAGVMLAILVSG